MKLQHPSLLLVFLFSTVILSAQAVESAESVKKLLGRPHILIDVRSPAEVSAEGMLPGAINIPLSELSQRFGDISKKKPVLVYCRSGNRSAQAHALLVEKGYKTYNLGAYSNLLETLK